MKRFSTAGLWTRVLVFGTIVFGAVSFGFAGETLAAEPAMSGSTDAAERIVLAQASPGAPTEAKPSPDSQNDLASMTIELVARPVVVKRGKAQWADGFRTIRDAIAKVDAAIGSAGLARAGRPFAVFLDTDEESFEFEAMIPVATKPQGKTGLPETIEIGTSPAGKAIKFQHRGPYDEIESTYNLITAFLDEKGLEAQNLFVEEYLTDTKEPDDVGLEADIYVFIK
jgi:effector-binding domain-containing protein